MSSIDQANCSSAPEALADGPELRGSEQERKPIERPRIACKFPETGKIRRRIQPMQYHGVIDGYPFVV